MITREEISDALEQIAGRYSNDRLKVTPAVIDAWHDELAAIKPLQIEKAIAQLGREYEKFPPSAMQFKRLCYSNNAGTSGTVRRCGRGGCPLTLSQADQYACTYHERVDVDRDSEVIDRMRACKLDIQFCFWLHDASPTEVMELDVFGAPAFVASMMQQYPRGESETIVDYKRRVKQSVDVLVLGDIPLRGKIPAAEKQKRQSFKPISDYEQLQAM